MERKIVNPVKWQDKFGFVQANEVSNAKKFLFTAGQVSVNAEGNLLYPNDMEKQLLQVLENMETLLDEADLNLRDVIKFTYYTTDINAFTKAAQGEFGKKLAESKCRPATSLIGINSLFHPDCVVEIEAVVAK